MTIKHYTVPLTLMGESKNFIKCDPKVYEKLKSLKDNEWKKEVEIISNLDNLAASYEHSYYKRIKILKFNNNGLINVEAIYKYTIHIKDNIIVHFDSKKIAVIER